MLVYADADGNAVFSMDQLRAAFGSLSIAAVTRMGEDLDRKVANLLRVIGIDASQALGARRGESGGVVDPAGFRRFTANYFVIAMRCA